DTCTLPPELRSQYTRAPYALIDKAFNGYVERSTTVDDLGKEIARQVHVALAKFPNANINNTDWPLLALARGVFVWIAYNVIYDVAFARDDQRTQNWSSQRPGSVLKTKRAVCEGYSELFVALCRHGGAPESSVFQMFGASKGRSFCDDDGGAINSVEVDANGNPSGHAWVGIVLQSGHCHLIVDPTWAAGAVSSANGVDTFIKAYEPWFFAVPPRASIYTHLPSHSDWQYIDNPLTNAEFASLPYLRPGFFKARAVLMNGDFADGCSLKLKSKLRPYIVVNMRARSGTLVSAQMSNTIDTRRVFVSRSNDSDAELITLYVAPISDCQSRILNIFLSGEHSAAFTLRPTRTLVPGFPLVYDNPDNYTLQLRQPITGSVALDPSYPVQFVVERLYPDDFPDSIASTLVLFVDDGSHLLMPFQQQIGTQKFSASIYTTVPEDARKIQIGYSKDGTTYQIMFVFCIVPYVNKT
ncbi:hypothetical protein HDU93_002017, partial [Gonapodya sp. JEL0774]